MIKKIPLERYFLLPKMRYVDYRACLCDNMTTKNTEERREK